jgi:flap endonuclease-1
MRVENLKSFSNKTIAIDASIYIYKFISRNALLENMYLMISILLSNRITPIFVFDGKPPQEKKELLCQRSRLKKEAEAKYNELKNELKESSDQDKTCVLMEMECLKKKFIRIKDGDMRSVKSLISAFGLSYYTAKGEADKLCVYLVKSGEAWACLSDDMDMFIYGCPRVLRHISLVKHTVILYDLDKMLVELNLSFANFKTIAILSGTDYNINDKITLYDSIHLYDNFKEEKASISFNDWLNNSNTIANDKLLELHAMFSVSDEDQMTDYVDKSFTSNFDDASIRNIMKTEGFVFV